MRNIKTGHLSQFARCAVVVCSVLLTAALPASAVPAMGADNAPSDAPYICFVELAATARHEGNPEGWSEAIAALRDKGCTTYLDYDFNKYSRGDYVVLGYTRTDDESKAIRSLVTKFVKRGETPPETYDVDGRLFHLASKTEFNSGTDYDQVFLYYTMDANAGSPLRELTTEDNYVEPNAGDHWRILINADDNKAELDYYQTDGCDSKYEKHCYLYRDYNEAYYQQLFDNQKMDYNIALGNQALGSVFDNHPTAVELIAQVLMLLLGGTLAVVLYKRSKKRPPKKE